MILKHIIFHCAMNISYETPKKTSHYLSYITRSFRARWITRKWIVISDQYGILGFFLLTQTLVVWRFYLPKFQFMRWWCVYKLSKTMSSVEVWHVHEELDFVLDTSLRFFGKVFTSLFVNHHHHFNFLPNLFLYDFCTFLYTTK